MRDRQQHRDARSLYLGGHLGRKPSDRRGTNSSAAATRGGGKVRELRACAGAGGFLRYSQQRIGAWQRVDRRGIRWTPPRLGDRWRRVRTGRAAVRYCMGAADNQAMQGRWRAMLYKTV